MNFLIYLLVFVVLYKVFISFHKEGFDGNCIKKVNLFANSEITRENVYNWKDDPVSFKNTLDGYYKLDISNLNDSYLTKNVVEDDEGDADKDDKFEFYDDINCKLEYLK